MSQLVTGSAYNVLKAGMSRLQSFARRLSSDYWKFLAAAFCMDLGFGLFFFLFNIYLTDLRLNERTIGQIMACLTVGNVVGTIPAMILVRRHGLRPLLLITFICTPVLCALRVLVIEETTQFALAFAAGIALCGWPICFSPTIAKLTNENNRSTGFSLAFATGIGLGTLAGFTGGYIPELLRSSTLHLSLMDGMKGVLLASCALTLLGSLPLLHLYLPYEPARAERRIPLFHPFMFRFLPAFVLWNVVTGSFPLFGAIYLQKVLGIPLGSIGAVFSVSHLVQFGAVLASPLLFRRIGIGRGVAVAQLGTALFLALLASMRQVPFAICVYLLYFAAQFMCGPGIYNLLMDRIPERERSTASAVQNVSGALCQAGTAAISGICIMRFGYSAVMLANAGIAVFASLLFFSLQKAVQLEPNHSEAPSPLKDAPWEDASDYSELSIQQVTK